MPTEGFRGGLRCFDGMDATDDKDATGHGPSKKGIVLIKRKIFTAFAATALCGAVLVGCSGNAGGSQAAATVNGTVIPESTVTADIQAFRASMELTDEDSWGQWLAETGYTPESFREETLEQLVDDEIVRQAAASEGVSVDKAEVDEYMDSMKSMYDTDEEWNEMLEESGMTEDQFRTEVEASMLQEALQEKVAAPTVDVSDGDVIEYYTENSDYYDGAKRSSAIVFDEGDAEQAQQVLQRIMAGEVSFADAAKEYSVDSESAANGGDMGWDVLIGFSDEYQDALAELAPGQMSGVVDTDEGPQIILCTEEFTAPEGEVSSVDIFPAALLEEMRESVVMSEGYSAYDEWIENYKKGITIEYAEVPTGLDYFVDMDKYASYATDQAEDELLEGDPDLEELMDDDEILLDDEEFLDEDELLEDDELLEEDVEEDEAA